MAFPAVVASLRETLGLSVDAFRAAAGRDAAFRLLRARVEETGIFVLLTGNLGSHHTNIEVEVFRGMALADEIAPFVVVNPHDSSGARCFTLLHELTHLWLGQTGVSGGLPKSPVERFCNDVASEYLLPRCGFRQLPGGGRNRCIGLGSRHQRPCGGVKRQFLDAGVQTVSQRQHRRNAVERGQRTFSNSMVEGPETPPRENEDADGRPLVLRADEAPAGLEPRRSDGPAHGVGHPHDDQGRTRAGRTGQDGTPPSWPDLSGTRNREPVRYLLDANVLIAMCGGRSGVDTLQILPIPSSTSLGEIPS